MFTEFTGSNLISIIALSARVTVLALVHSSAAEVFFVLDWLNSRARSNMLWTSPGSVME